MADEERDLGSQAKDALTRTAEMVGSTVGSRLLLVVPPGDGYGDAGNETASIPPGETLVYVIDVLGAH